jgi:hypothetical protein
MLRALTSVDRRLRHKNTLSLATGPEVHLPGSSNDDVCVRVCSELEWYRWAWNGQLPRTREVPIYLLWAE